MYRCLAIFFSLFFALSSLGQKRPPKPRHFVAKMDMSEVVQLFDASVNAADAGNDSLALTYLIDAVVEGRNHRFSEKMLQIELYYSKALLDLGAPKLALQNLNHVERFPLIKRNSVYFRRLKQGFGMVHLGMKNYPEAKSTFLEIYKRDQKSPDSKGMASPLNNLGYVYYLSGDLDSAKIFLEMARSNQKKNSPQDSIFYGVIMDNLALISVEERQYRDALTIFLKNMRIQKSAKRSNKYLPTLIKIADTYSRMGVIDSSEYYFSVFRNDIRTAERVNPVQERTYWMTFYSKYITHQKRHHSQEFIQNARFEFLSYQDSVRSSNARSLDILLSQIQRLMERSRMQLNQIVDLEHERTVNHLEKERQRSRMAKVITVGVIIGFLLLALFIFIAVRSRMRNSKYKAQALETENRLTQLQLRNESLEKTELQQKLMLQRKESTDLALEIKRKREWVKEIQVQLHGVKNKEDIDDALRKFIPNIHIDDKQELFLERIDELNESFYDELLSRFPNLTPSEKELCGLVRLKLSSKEIAASRQITVNAVKVARRRLRKKLALKPEDDLYGFIAGI